MLNLGSQNRITIPCALFQDIKVVPSDKLFRLYFSEKENCIIFSTAGRKGKLVHIGVATFDNKRRIYLPKCVVQVIPELLNVGFKQMYFCLNENGELCIKKVPN